MDMKKNNYAVVEVISVVIGAAGNTAWSETF